MFTPSQKCSQILSSCSQRNQVMTLLEENEIRNYYLSLIGDSKLSLQGVIDKISQELAADYGSLMNYSPAVVKKTLYYQNQRVVSVDGKTVVSLGRMKENDIVQNDLNVSRINCLIFIYQNKMAILDSWSLNGTICTNMKTGEEFETCHGRRRIITFDRYDVIMIKTHGGSIIINPEKCLVCEVNPKQVLLSCGHLEVCHLCYRKIKNSSDSEILCSKCFLPIRGLLGKGTKIFRSFNPENKPFPFNVLNYPCSPIPLSSSASFEDSDSVDPWQDSEDLWQELLSSSFSSSSENEIRINQSSIRVIPSPILVKGSEGSGKRKRLQEKRLQEKIDENVCHKKSPTKKIKLLEPRQIVKSETSIAPQEHTYQIKPEIIRRSLSEKSCLTGIYIKSIIHCRVSPRTQFSSQPNKIHRQPSSIPRSLSFPSRITKQKIPY